MILTGFCAFGGKDWWKPTSFFHCGSEDSRKSRDNEPVMDNAAFVLNSNLSYDFITRMFVERLPMIRMYESIHFFHGSELSLFLPNSHKVI